MKHYTMVCDRCGLTEKQNPTKIINQAHVFKSHPDIHTWKKEEEMEFYLCLDCVKELKKWLLNRNNRNSHIK